MFKRVSIILLSTMLGAACKEKEEINATATCINPIRNEAEDFGYVNVGSWFEVGDVIQVISPKGDPEYYDSLELSEAPRMSHMGDISSSIEMLFSVKIDVDTIAHDELDPLQIAVSTEVEEKTVVSIKNSDSHVLRNWLAIANQDLDLAEELKTIAKRGEDRRMAVVTQGLRADGVTLEMESGADATANVTVVQIGEILVNIEYSCDSVFELAGGNVIAFFEITPIEWDPFRSEIRISSVPMEL